MATQTQHTPGPWCLHDEQPDRLVVEVHPVEEPVGDEEYGDHAIAAVLLETGGREESRANARLIAAAPDLLAACEAVLDALNHADLDGAVIWIRPPWQDAAVHESATERLGAALAKAKGDLPSLAQAEEK